MKHPATFPVHLHSAGVSVIVATDDAGRPCIVHWGAEVQDLPDVVDAIVRTAGPGVPFSSYDEPRSVSLLPTPSEGWAGSRGIAWHVGGAAGSDLVPSGAERVADGVIVRFVDGAGSLLVSYELRLTPAGVLEARVIVESTGPADVAVDLTAVRLLFPVPDRAREQLDYTGRWSGERRAQRRSIGYGTWARATHRGRPGHDAPFLTAVGTPDFGHRRGEVWATHTGWSGSTEHIIERLPEGVGSSSALIGGGELLEPGEVRLAQGERYESPVVCFVYSDRGLDGVAERFHRRVRSGRAHPRGPRPLVLNTWEAIYYAHDFPKLAHLADIAASVGVERFVLDDGWSMGRRNDRAGLGDWDVDETVWPGGLSRLSDHVHALGMEFGLWFEPEMVNLDSTIAREHPEWILGATPARSWRHQHVLNLANPDAWQYVSDRIHLVVGASGVDFIKWDHNRDLGAPTDRSTGASVGHDQTLAVYRMMDALRQAHPGLEIESCASGGGRVDLGMMEHAQRVWASDTNDPVERQAIQLGTSALLPPEVVGAHVGPEVAHTSHRSTALSFRLATALFAHAGIEWDLTACSADELEALRRWADLYKELRPLLHTGVTVHADDVDDGASLTGIVSADRSHAVYCWSRVATSASSHAPRMPFPGIDSRAAYSVRVRTEIGLSHLHGVRAPEWFPEDDQPVTLPGSVLGMVGVPLPTLDPGNALIIELVAVATPTSATGS